MNYQPISHSKFVELVHKLSTFLMVAAFVIMSLISFSVTAILIYTAFTTLLS